MAAFAASGNLPEPVWHALLGVLAFCHDGEGNAHYWSSNDFPEYSPTETQGKLDRSRALSGPTTCARLYDLNPEGCVGCKWRGKITTPCEVVASGAVERGLDSLPSGGDLGGSGKTIDGYILPSLGKPFAWGDKGELLVRSENQGGDPIEIKVCDQPVVLLGVQTGEIERGTYSYRFNKHLPIDGWENVLIDAAALHGSGGIATMFGRGIVIHDGKAFLNYARWAVDDYHHRESLQMRYDQYGWKNEDTSFYFGKHLYTPVGPIEAIGAKEVTTRQQWLGPKPGGSLPAWTEAADSLFASNMEATSAAVLASFAAPLMKFQARDEGGAILHLYSRASGYGKTTALTGAWTAWGVKDGLSLTNEDTRVSKPILMGALGNLPVIYDELSDRDPEAIRKMVVMFTEGRDRMRGTVDGTIRHTKARWQTILLSASNESLVDVLAGTDDDAPSYRVMQLDLEAPKFTEKEKRDKLVRVLNDNSGWAGDAYLRYITQPSTLEWLHSALKQWTDEIWSTTGLGAPFRFRVRLVGAIAVAAAITNELGLLHFDVERITQYLIDQLQKDKVTAFLQPETPIEKAVSAFGEFINEHFGETLVVPDKFYARGARMVPILRPHNRLTVRYEIKPQLLYVAYAPFAEWCNKHQHSARLVLKAMEAHGIVLNGRRNVTLSAGTDIPGAQVGCIELNAGHPALGGFVQAVQQAQAV